MLRNIVPPLKSIYSESLSAGIAAIADTRLDFLQKYQAIAIESIGINY